MIDFPQDRQNHRTDLGSRGVILEYNWQRLAVTLSWWLSWIIAMNCIEYTNIYTKTEWEKVRTTNDTRVNLESNSSIEFENNILYNMDILNDWMYICCIIFGLIWSTKRMGGLYQIRKFIWGSNHVYMTKNKMSMFSCVDSWFLFLSRNVMRSVILSAMNSLILKIFDNVFL